MKNSHSHPTRRKFKKYLAALLLPLLLLLTACDLNTYVKLNENNTADIQTEMKFSKSELEMLSMGGETPSCEEILKDNAAADAPEFVVTDLSADGNLHCKAEATNQPLEVARNNAQDSITNEDGIYTVDLKGDDSIDLSMLGLTGNALNISMTYEFPGNVIEASAGQVDGNKVTVNDISVAKEGLHIKAYSTQKMVLAPWALWLIIGLGVLLLAGLIFWLLRRKKKPAADQHGHPGSGYGAGQPAPYGQPHLGQQPGQQPGQQAHGQQGAWSPQSGQQGQGFQQPSQQPGQQPQAYGQQQWQPQQGQQPGQQKWQQPQSPTPYGQGPQQGHPQQGHPQQGQPQWQPQQPYQGQPGQQGQFGGQGQQPQPPREGEVPPHNPGKPADGE